MISEVKIGSALMQTICIDRKIAQENHLLTMVLHIISNSLAAMLNQGKILKVKNSDLAMLS